MHHLHDYAWYDIFEILVHWFQGDTDKNDTYGWIRFLWLNRIGSFLQFCAGLSIVLEILGRERVQKAKVDLENLISLRKIKDTAIDAITIDKYDYKDWPYLSFALYIGAIYGLYRLLTRPKTVVTNIVSLSKSHHRFNPTELKRPLYREEDLEKMVTTFFGSYHLLFVLILAGITLLCIPWTRSMIQIILQIPIKLALLLLLILALLLVELFMLKPLIFYLKISKTEKHIKVFNFFIFIFVFFLSFIFS